MSCAFMAYVQQMYIIVQIGTLFKQSYASEMEAMYLPLTFVSFTYQTLISP